MSLQRGIIVNREVQIRRGQKTDIHIDAVNPNMDGGIDIIKVIIEVKGCWNLELETAMESQLVGKYLQENRCSNGLYLVGWFKCDKWSDTDHYRKRDYPKYCFEEAKEHFTQQAKDICLRSQIPGIELRSYAFDVGLR